MTKALINPKTGLVDNPIHPCYKVPEEGLCMLRVYGESKFECSSVQTMEFCRYREMIDKRGG